MPVLSTTGSAPPPDDFHDIPSRVAAYAGSRDPSGDLDALYDRIAAEGERPVWISLLPRERAQALLSAATARVAAGVTLPLYGVPFAVKDNIDVAGLPTTAACPDFAYHPTRSATVVERLVAAGAIPVGKTNLDQFATGLNGTRSPYGVPTSAFSDRHVSGGSSSGSAVAVACGLVPFALGTDTAGSGRVPAAFNNIVGLKPTKGLLSTRGIVPACRSQDCVSIFAASVGDAITVLRAAAGFDGEDAFSREAPQPLPALPAVDLRFGVPSDAVLAACAPGVRAGFEAACAALARLGGKPVAIDYGPFQQAAEMLYAGPWVAERLAAVSGLLASRPDAIHPAVREVVRAGERYTALDAFAAQERLAFLRREARRAWAEADLIVLPTAPEHPTVAAMLADPIGCNTRLGLFTNFVNLMDLAALAVPAGFDAAGLPVGVTLVGPAFSDEALAALGDRLHRALPGARLAASGRPLAAARPYASVPLQEERVRVAVVGAHLTGQPLNRQLTERQGRLLATTRTAAGYSLYALPGTVPPKPGLLRDGGRGGIEVEIWSLPVEAYGSFVAGIPSPLGIGTLELADGSTAQGFLCEPYAVAGALDITDLGGWRAYLATQSRAA
jgi:allophanate hydrolase